MIVPKPRCQSVPDEHRDVGGLGAVAAAERRRRDGLNELPREQPRAFGRIVRDAVREPMLQLLLAAGVIYLVIGDLAEALILLGFAILNVGLVVVQESRTEKALAALKDLTGQRATVIRDGSRCRIPARELVVGDIIILQEGDRVPADARVITDVNLEADESLLTGESVPVRKRSGAGVGDARPGAEVSASAWSGTLIVRGNGIAEVVATGVRTEIGRIGTSLGDVTPAPTPLQRQTRRLVWVFTAAGGGSSVLLAVAYGTLHGDWIKAILAGITLAMATLPEELPLVLTIFLVLGAWRISTSHVLARRSAAIEALGAMTVLCTDKTGTLTLNRMSVAKLRTKTAEWEVSEKPADELPEPLHELLEFAILASRPDPFDPMERAFHELGDRFLKHTEHLHADWVLAHDYPLDPALLAMSQAWKATASDHYIIAAKGAPEAIADLCHLRNDEIEVLRAEVTKLAAEGLRVLAVARGGHHGPGWPDHQHAFDFTFLGLLGLIDPLRPGVPEAVEACRGAGIRIAMITGDHPATARAIARQAGLASDDVLTGAEMMELDDAALGQRIRRTGVFARVMPEQKLRLVKAFQDQGEVVAMTGDGVNDAPSLKAAHIGVAMGGRGTDVAREAAALVLLNDDFTSLVAAVRLGRRIDDNLRKAISYVLAVHVPIAGMSLIPVLLGWPMLFGPIHVVFLELIIDPMSSVVFEAEPEAVDIMARPPRDPNAPLIGLALLARGLLQGLVVLAVALAVYLVGFSPGGDEHVARGMAFITLVVGNLGLVMANRAIGSSAFRAALRPNRALLVALCATLATLGLVLLIPQLRGLFEFAPLGPWQMAIAAAAGAAAFAAIDLIGAAVRWIMWALRDKSGRATG